MKIPRLVKPLTGSLGAALGPITTLLTPADGHPVEMAAPQLAADLVPQVYRPVSASLMSSASILTA